MHDRVSVNSICFMSQPLQVQADYWRLLGARRVSLLGPQLTGGGMKDAQRALATGDYAVETIVHPSFAGPRLDPDKDNWGEPRQRLASMIGIASALGARSIYMTTGGIGGLTWEQAAETFAAMIAPCAEQARSEGVALMIENTPPQYADLHTAHNLRDTVRLADLAGIGVLIDLPSCWTEAGLQQTIEQVMPLCHLVQVSDYVCGDRALPARAVPGDGDMPLERLLGWILTAGYQGVFDLELLGPRIDQEGHLEATQRAALAMEEMLNALGA
jgi:sugar phosphate isomerase/epimerase